MSISGIDIFNYSDEDIISVCDNFAKATAALRLPHKYVFTDKSPDLFNQQNFLKYKQERADGFNASYIRNQIILNSYLEANQRDKLSYLLVFADTNQFEELKKNCGMYINALKGDLQINLLSKHEIKKFLRKYLCCSDVPTSEQDILPCSYEKKQSYSIIDNNYVTTMIVNNYPAEIKNLELTSLIQRISNATVTLDVSTKLKEDVLDELEGSINELDSRFRFNKSETDDADTITELNKLREIRENVVNGKEQMMYVTLRIIVSAHSLKELKNHVDLIEKDLENEGISAFVPFNEMREEFINLLRFDNFVKTPFPLHDTFKMQFPFFYQQHLDNKAFIFGTSATSGLVALDFYVKNAVRQSFDLMIFGLKGSGKSVTCKSLVRDYVSLGNKIMALDMEGEYQDIVDVHNGKIIRMNKNSIINVFQIRKTIDETREKDASNETNFAAELSRIMTFFYQYLPDLNSVEAEELKDIIFETYEKKGITESTDVTTLSPSDFPIFSDVLETLRCKLYDSDGNTNPKFTERKVDMYQKLETCLKQLSEGIYKSMFNGYTNIDLSNSNLIVFDVKAISEMEERIYNAQLFNILSLMWSEICKNVEYNNHILNPFDRKYVACLIDEAHRFINTKNPQVTEFIEKLVRRTRKYDAALWLASQALTDFNPSGDKDGNEKIKTIFSLVQYKIIMKQSYENLEAIRDTFVQFTSSEVEATTTFEPGEMLVSLGAGRNKLHCVKYIDTATLLYCGNSRDREEIVHRFFDELYNEKSYDEYADLIAEQRVFFQNGFTNEVMECINYSRTDSEALYTIVYNAVSQFVSEMCAISEKNQLSYDNMNEFKDRKELILC